MWALGVLICDMMGGFTPFDTGLCTPFGIYQNIIEGHMRLPKSLGRVGTDLVVRLLQVNENNRLSPKGVMEHPFFMNEVKTESYWNEV